MAETSTKIRALGDALTAERMRCLAGLLAVHLAYMKGVSAPEAAAWLGFEPGRDSETTAGILLHKLGYASYRRRHAPYDRRLFPKGGAPETWR